MRNNIFKQADAKIKAYFESLIVKETIEYRLKILNGQKNALQAQREFDESGLCDKQGSELEANRLKKLRELNCEIFTLTSNINLIEKECAGTAYLLETLPERERAIIYGRYRDKKSYLKIGCEVFLSESRVHQIVCAVLEHFNKINKLTEQKT
jgi:hypothetical protein